MYICNICGYGSASWYGKCPECNEWNTFEKKESAPKGAGKKGAFTSAKKAQFVDLKSVKSLSDSRRSTGMFECDRVLGGGFVLGEVVFIAGEPGVGKSTLLLSFIDKFKVAYISGEESAEQVKLRAQRLGLAISSVLFTQDNNVDSILSALESQMDQFELIVIDSIQTVHTPSIPSPQGTVSQIKESASLLIEFAKRNQKILVIVGHVTKDGDIAGPKTLEHVVDCVLYLEGERESQYRVLRSKKNRFGPTDEVGLFEMKENGLSEVKEPTAFLEHMSGSLQGSSTIAVVEGSRVMFYEIQSLVVKTSLPVPRRVVAGIDYNRLQLLLAVVRKYLHINFDEYDVYVSVVGGVTAKHPTADVGIAMSILSSLKDSAIPSKTVCIGEIGLLGEIRSSYYQSKAITEAKRLGFTTVISSKNADSVKKLSTYFKHAR